MAEKTAAAMVLAVLLLLPPIVALAMDQCPGGTLSKTTCQGPAFAPPGGGLGIVKSPTSFGAGGPIPGRSTSIRNQHGLAIGAPAMLSDNERVPTGAPVTRKLALVQSTVFPPGAAVTLSAR